MPFFSNKGIKSNIETIEGNTSFSFVSTNISDILDYSSTQGMKIEGVGKVTISGSLVERYDGGTPTDDELSLLNGYEEYCNYWVWISKNIEQMK